MALLNYIPSFIGSNYGIIGVLILIAIVWYFIAKSRSGRIGEEQQEERETDQLRKDEIEEVKIQKDERRQCKKLDYLFSDIMIILKNSGQSGLADEISNLRRQISLILSRELGEKMGVQTAINTFRELNSLIDQFLSRLPNNNTKINNIVQEIRKHQQEYYQDLIKELKMNRVKKLIVTKLWRQIIDEESGQGQTKAA